MIVTIMMNQLENKDIVIMSKPKNEKDYAFALCDITICRYDEDGNEELNLDGTPKLYRISNDHLYDVVSDTANDEESYSFIEPITQKDTYSLDRIIAISDDIKNDTEWVNSSKTKATYEGVCSGLNMLINHLKEIEESEVSK